MGVRGSEDLSQDRRAGRSRARRQRALILASLALLAVGCQDDDSGTPGLPTPVDETRSAILDAAEAGSYDRLPPLLNDDQLPSWRKQGPGPLETMAVLLRMRHQVRETNEGTLYQWPRFGPNSKPEDVSDSERAQLRQVITGPIVFPDYGYTAPRLGILADGRWWFFVLNRAP